MAVKYDEQNLSLRLPEPLRINFQRTLEGAISAESKAEGPFGTPMQTSDERWGVIKAEVWQNNSLGNKPGSA